MVKKSTRMKVFLVACVVLATLCGKRCSAQLTSQVATQLSREEKQLALELHNNLRASAQAADMRQLVSVMSIKPIIIIADERGHSFRFCGIS